MTKYALQATITTDNSSATIDKVSYVRSLEATIETDKSNMTIDKVSYIRGLTANIFTDKSKAIAGMTRWVSNITNIFTDKSKATIDGKRGVATSATINVQPARTNIFLTAWRATKGVLSSDSSSITISPKITRALTATLETDKSSFTISKVERDILTEAPTGQTYVIIKGVDVTLNGYNLTRNSVHAINILIYGDRLTKEGTDIEFIVKRNISDPDNTAVIYSSTNKGGIKFIQVKTLPDSTIREYKAQIQLKESDFYLITNQRPTKLYYEVRVIDSLDGRYPPVEAGSFNLMTTLVDSKWG
jgi:hypothetical protein